VSDLHTLSRPAVAPSLILFGSIAMLFITGASPHLVAVSLKDMTADFGGGRTIPSSAFALTYIGSGVGGILMGWIVDRYGFGIPAFTGAIMVSLGGLMTSIVDQSWQLLTIYAVMFGLSGQGALAAPAMANISRWYEHRRAMAVGMVSSGQALAGIIWLPVFGWAVDLIGWRDLYFLFGVVACIVLLPVAWLIRHKPPKSQGLSRPVSADGSTNSEMIGSIQSPRLSINTIQISLTVAILGCCLAMAMPLAHLVAFVTDVGHTRIQGATVLSAVLFSAFISRAALLGLIAGRIGGLWSLLMFSGIQGAMLGMFTLSEQLWALYTCAVLFGLGYGGIFPIYSVAVRDHLPHHQTGWRTGVIFSSGAVAMGAGGWLGGYMFDTTGSYEAPFLIGVAANGFNVVIVVWLIAMLRPLRQRSLMEAGSAS
jgi:MFS family permease